MLENVFCLAVIKQKSVDKAVIVGCMFPVTSAVVK